VGLNGDTMDTLAKRLRHARKARNLTQVELAEKSGVAQSDISKIERGETLSTTKLVALSNALNVNPNWLDTGDGEMTPAVRLLPGVSLRIGAINLDNNPDFPAIRRVRFKLSAGASGFGVDYADEDGDPIVFRKVWFEKNGYEPDRLFAVRVANGSMEPGLYDGDTVVVNTQSATPKDGTVFAVNYEGEMVIKRLIRDAGQWWLASDNPDQRRYPRKVCDENSIIIGEIVHKQSERI